MCVVCSLFVLLCVSLFSGCRHVFVADALGFGFVSVKPGGVLLFFFGWDKSCMYFLSMCPKGSHKGIDQLLIPDDLFNMFLSGLGAEMWGLPVPNDS